MADENDNQDETTEGKSFEELANEVLEENEAAYRMMGKV